MQFLREDQPKAVRTIAARICGELRAGKRVLWLTSGGSNVAAEVEIMKLVRRDAEERLASLAVMPMDERFGPSGHPNSNTGQLRMAGFDPSNAVWVDVLIHNVSFEETAKFYNDVASAALTNAGVVIGQFGLGTDAHTAGVLPSSPAVEADEVTVAGYKWQDYDRMTLTPQALAQIQVAYVLAYGEGKKAALKRLAQNTEPLSQLPAKLLYDIPEVYVYNDQLENKE